MRIVDLVPTNESAIQQVAELLVEGFARNWPDANGPGKPDILMA